MKAMAKSRALQSHTNHQLRRFLLVVVIVIAYFIYTVYSYGLSQGVGITALTWAFFVFATPVADGGFLIAFPIRLVTGFRMLYTQYIVWAVGCMLVVAFLVFNPAAFQRSPLTQLFYAILTTPWPLWLILVLSAAGTYLNILLDDKVVDVAGSNNRSRMLQRNRKRLFYNSGILVVTVMLYVTLLAATNTPVPFL